MKMNQIWLYFLNTQVLGYSLHDIMYILVTTSKGCEEMKKWEPVQQGIKTCLTESV